MSVLISNLQDKLKVTEEIENIIEEVIEQVFKVEDMTADKEVSVALVDDKHIQELNHKYRQKNKPTDVLSFPLNGEDLLGDIVISLETAQRQAEEYNHSFAREVGFLTVHSMLHLLGYSHYESEERKIMRSKEEEILVSLDLTRD